METIVNDVLAELKYANEKWGTSFDDKNTANDWASYLSIYSGKATAMGATPEEFRKNMIKVAVVAIGAVAAFDRNGGLPPRHYDNKVA